MNPFIARGLYAHPPHALLYGPHHLSDEDTNAPARLAESEHALRAAVEVSGEEAWAGWIGVLGEQEKLEAALELASRAQRMFPDSELISEAVEFAGQCTAP